MGGHTMYGGANGGVDRCSFRRVHYGPRIGRGPAPGLARRPCTEFRPDRRFVGECVPQFGYDLCQDRRRRLTLASPLAQGHRGTTRRK